MPPKKFSFRGKTNIRVVFFLGGGWGSGFSKDSVYAIALIGVWAKHWLFRSFLPNSKILTVSSSFPVLTLRNALLLSFQRLDNPPVQSHLLYLKLHE